MTNAVRNSESELVNNSEWPLKQKPISLAAESKKIRKILFESKKEFLSSINYRTQRIIVRLRRSSFDSDVSANCVLFALYKLNE